jgi:hypothetical protein
VKWYLTVACDNTVADPFVADTAQLRGVDEWAVMAGERLPEWPPDWCVAARSKANDGTPDDVLQNSLGIPIYSERLQQRLTAWGIQNIQYLPIRVLRPTGALIDGFAIANVLACRSALDLERSDLGLFPDDYFIPSRRGKVRSVRQPVLRAAALDEIHCLRAIEYPVQLFVSDHFRQAFESAQLSGYSFEQIDVR